LFGKRWRLWELPGNSGQVLLNSPTRFEATTDAAAVELAEQSIRRASRYGVDEWNYRISPGAGGTFTLQLQDPAGVILANRDAPLISMSAAERALALTVEHLYRNYSAEGFFLIEHLLLRPRQAGEPFLSLPVDETTRERDPYSQRLSIVFPSGFARDFDLPRDTAPMSQVTPDRFRDPEFRRHVERTVQQACPAHLMPTVHWVDRQAAGTAASLASFDTFEQRYFTWLNTVLIPGAAASAVSTARNELAEALNAIANDAP
jgi:hypothetical protein